MQGGAVLCAIGSEDDGPDYETAAARQRPTERTVLRDVYCPRLLASIHDVGPRFESEVDQLRDRLGRALPVERIALLVVPDHWGEAPLKAGTAFAGRLRRWSDAGAEVFLHGWFHQDRSNHSGMLARAQARHLTAGEGEFLGLSYDAACERMRAGTALLEDILGRGVSGFIAPAWLYGAPARRALVDCGFALAEDHWRVWNPQNDRVLCRSPVLTWASRSRARVASSLLAGKFLPPLLKAFPTARIGVHPGDTTVPALLTNIDAALARLCRSHRPSRYAELQKGAAPCAC